MLVRVRAWLNSKAPENACEVGQTDGIPWHEQKTEPYVSQNVEPARFREHVGKGLAISFSIFLAVHAFPCWQESDATALSGAHAAKQIKV